MHYIYRGCNAQLNCCVAMGQLNWSNTVLWYSTVLTDIWALERSWSGVKGFTNMCDDTIQFVLTSNQKLILYNSVGCTLVPEYSEYIPPCTNTYCWEWHVHKQLWQNHRPLKVINLIKINYSKTNNERNFSFGVDPYHTYMYMYNPLLSVWV